MLRQAKQPVAMISMPHQIYAQARKIHVQELNLLQCGRGRQRHTISTNQAAKGTIAWTPRALQRVLSSNIGSTKADNTQIQLWRAIRTQLEDFRQRGHRGGQLCSVLYIDPCLRTRVWMRLSAHPAIAVSTCRRHIVSELRSCI